MLRRSCLLSAIILVTGTTAAVPDEPQDRAMEIPGWGRVVDPSQDCTVTLRGEDERLTIRVPGTPHVLSAEVPRLPMNAPRVVRRVRGDFTAGVHVLGQLEPGPSRTTLYDPYHGAGLIVWQDPSTYLRLERAVGFIDGRDRPYINYEWREGGRLAISRGLAIADGPLFLELRRHGGMFAARYSRDGLRWAGLGRIDTTFPVRIEAGVIAVNSSTEPLSAELEMFHVEDARGSMARDGVDPDTTDPPRPRPPSLRSPPARPGRLSILFDPNPGRKSFAGPPTRVPTERDGFHW